MLLRVLWYCYEFSRNQWLKPAELKRLQEKRLKAILKHVYENVPLYHQKFESVGVKPADIKSIEDLPKLPFTTKQEVRSGIPDQSIAKGYDINKCVEMSTSGTTGGPMPVFYDKRFLDYCMANWYYRRIRAIGANPWDKIMLVEYGMPQPNILHDDQGERGYESKRKSMGRIALGPIVSLLRRRRRRVYITYTADHALAEMFKFQPKLVDGNVSCLRLIAEAIVDRGIEDIRPKVVRTNGEVVDEFTRRFLESSFKCEVFDEYSTWDFGHGAWECTRREGYHIDADLLILEITRNNEQVAPGEQGEIVVTGLSNYAMPLIRYRVGDVGVVTDEMCSCGRGLPLLKSIEGRIVDCFTLPGGRTVSPKVIMSAVQGTPGVSRYQVVQESRNKVTVELMRGKDDPEVSIDELTARCREVLGDDVEIEVFVGDRKNLKAKFRPVISKLTVSGETRWTKPRARAGAVD